MPSKREDDKFLRKIIWYLGLLALTSAGAIAAMQVQINGNSKAVDEIRETNKTLNQINVTLQKVLDSGKHRNSMMLVQAKKQEAFEKRQLYIFGEQKNRSQTIKDSQRHIRDRGLHK